jgi:alpha-methylacyl-CoA racemase
VLSWGEATDHPHNVARGAFLARGPAPAPRFSRSAPGAPGPAPAVGEQTDAVLSELGLDAGAIGALRTAGTIA